MKRHSNHSDTRINKTVKVDYRTDDQAILTQFTNGTLPPSKKQNIHFGIYRNCDENNPKSKTRKLLVAETDKMSYVGQNFGTAASKAQNYYKYYIGILDKTTGKMRVCDAAVYQMHPKVVGQEEFEEPRPLSLPSNADLTLTQKNDMLTMAFGSKKKQRAMESRLKNVIKGKALDEAIASAVSNTDTSQLSDSKNDSQNEQGTIPPFNREATEPKDVYSLENVISSSEMDALSVPANIFFDSTLDQIKQWKKEETYPKFILNRLMLMPQTEDTRLTRSKCLVYLDYLIKMYKMTAGDWRKRSPLPDSWPDPVKKQLYDNFVLTVDGDKSKKQIRCMPARLKDKLVSYILVLCLIIDEFRVECSDLLLDLTMGLRKIQTHFRALGCQFKTQKLQLKDGEKYETKMAYLVVPLTFPEPSKRKKAQRR